MANKNTTNFKKVISIVLSIILLFSFLTFIYYFQFSSTGKAILGIKTSYKEGEILQGELKLSLKSGELIPAGSLVKVEMNNGTYQYALSDLINSEKNNGDFYADGVSLIGNGEGYGVIGTKEIPQDVTFTFTVKKLSEEEKKQEEENKNTTETINSTSEGTTTQPSTTTQTINSTSKGTTTQPSTTTQTTTETSGTTDKEKTDKEKKSKEKNNSGSALTGKVVSEISVNIDGTVSKDKPYTYELNEGETAEIISSLQDVKLEISGNTVTVTTDYAEIEEGFGKDYLGDSVEYELAIDLSKLELVAIEGPLKVSLLYNDVEITSVSTSLSIDSPEQSNQSAIIINATTNATNITVVSENILDYALTTDEIFALQGKTGSSTVKVTKAEIINDRLVIRFEIGSYWLENSYEYTGSIDDLKDQIDLDKAKWVKRLAKSILKEKPSVESVDELLGEKDIKSLTSSKSSSEEKVIIDEATNETENNSSL